MGARFICDVQIHPAANLFPEMGDDDLASLTRSIRANGVRVPVVFCDGQLIDGRNRMRAALAAGMSTDRVPRRNLPSDTDPYLWAWDANCSRLDYTIGQKAAIRVKIEEASGDLARQRATIAEAANKARSEKAKEQHAASNPRAGEKSGRASSDASPATPRKTAARIAEAAKVSVPTVERVMKLKREDPAAFERLAATGHAHEPKKRVPAGAALKNSPNANFVKVPRAIPALAAFLRERLTSKEVADLIERLRA